VLHISVKDALAEVLPEVVPEAEWHAVNRLSGQRGPDPFGFGHFDHQRTLG